MKHFLPLEDIDSAQLHELLDLAIRLKKEFYNGGNELILKGKILAMIFEKPSLRTRASFEVAMVDLGGYVLNLLPQEVKMGGREAVSDVARVLSGYVDCVMARVFKHSYLEELAAHGSVPIINGLSEKNHPNQALADLMTIMENRAKLEGLTVTYVGDANNVALSLMRGAMLTGINFRIASPAGYSFTEEQLEAASNMRISDKQKLETYENPVKAVSQADVVYTDVFTSMGQESETERRLEVFLPTYQLNRGLLAHAKTDHLFMHCLPAHRGEEVTDEVVDGPNSVVFPQAQNRLHAQKAVLAKLLGDV